MLKNIYGPLSGAKGQEQLLEIIANNLANTNTPAYKEDQITFKAMGSNPWDAYSSPLPPAPFKTDMSALFPLHGNEFGYAAVSNISVSHVQGPLKQTANPLDMALEGDGFFVVQTPFGERLTRSGDFSLTPEGTLVNKSGALVMGQQGPVTGLSEGQLRVLPTGEVYAGESLVEKLKVVSVPQKEALQRLGDNLFIYDGDPQALTPSTARVAQGVLESSNVNPMRNLTNMIIAHRNYEALQKVVKAHDETMQLGATKVGEAGGG